MEINHKVEDGFIVRVFLVSMFFCINKKEGFMQGLVLEVGKEQQQ